MQNNYGTPTSSLNVKIHSLQQYNFFLNKINYRLFRGTTTLLNIYIEDSVRIQNEKNSSEWPFKGLKRPETIIQVRSVLDRACKPGGYF
jgi:hypothetical protein